MLAEENVVAFFGAEVFTLTATPEEIHDRVMADGVASRPVLGSSDDLLATITSLLAERQEAYAKFTSVDTTGKSIEQVVDALRDAGAPIDQEKVVDPEAAKGKVDQILYGVIVVAAVIVVILLILVLTF